MTTKTIQITEGPYKGKYEIAENGKIFHVQRNSRGLVRTTVGRGTKRHAAVLAAA